MSQRTTPHICSGSGALNQVLLRQTVTSLWGRSTVPGRAQLAGNAAVQGVCLGWKARVTFSLLVD